MEERTNESGPSCRTHTLQRVLLGILVATTSAIASFAWIAVPFVSSTLRLGSDPSVVTRLACEGLVLLAPIQAVVYLTLLYRLACFVRDAGYPTRTTPVWFVLNYVIPPCWLMFPQLDILELAWAVRGVGGVDGSDVSNTGWGIARYAQMRAIAAAFTVYTVCRALVGDAIDSWTLTLWAAVVTAVVVNATVKLASVAFESESLGTSAPIDPPANEAFAIQNP